MHVGLCACVRTCVRSHACMTVFVGRRGADASTNRVFNFWVPGRDHFVLEVGVRCTFLTLT